MQWNTDRDRAARPFVPQRSMLPHPPIPRGAVQGWTLRLTVSWEFPGTLWAGVAGTRGSEVQGMGQALPGRWGAAAAAVGTALAGAPGPVGARGGGPCRWMQMTVTTWAGLGAGFGRVRGGTRPARRPAIGLWGAVLGAAVLWAAMALMAAAGPGGAEAMPCAARGHVVALLADRYGETRLAAAPTGDAGVLELFASTVSGGWTLILSRPDGQSCLVASGLGLRGPPRTAQSAAWLMVPGRGVRVLPPVPGKRV